MRPASAPVARILSRTPTCALPTALREAVGKERLALLVAVRFRSPVFQTIVVNLVGMRFALIRAARRRGCIAAIHEAMVHELFANRPALLLSPALVNAMVVNFRGVRLARGHAIRRWRRRLNVTIFNQTVLKELIANVPALLFRPAVGDAILKQLQSRASALILTTRRRRRRRRTAAVIVDAMGHEFMRRASTFILRPARVKAMVEKLRGLILALHFAVRWRRLMTILGDAILQKRLRRRSALLLRSAFIDAMMERVFGQLPAMLYAIGRRRRLVAMLLHAGSESIVGLN